MITQPSSPVPHPAPRATILAVDDNPEALDLLSTILTPAGYLVRSALSGEQTLAAVAANPPDLILLDVRMPGMSGIDICRRLMASEDKQRIPIILLSAYADAAEWVEGLQLGAADYITKPFHPEELLTRVKTHLTLHRAQASLEQQAAALRQANAQMQSEISERRKLEAELLQSLDRAERSRRAVLGTLEDWQRATAAMRGSEEKYRNLVETAQELVWKCDAQGRFNYLNPAWETTHGYKIEEMLGRSFGEFQRPEVFARDIQEFARCLAGGSVNGYETTHLAKDGRELTLLFNATFVRDRMGEIIGTQGTAVDITARKRADNQIRQALAEKEILLKEVHHRVKNNLQIVSSLLELQAEGLRDPSIREALRESKSRIQSIALVHEKLYQSSGLARLDFRAYIQSLIAYLFHAHLGRGCVVGLDLRMPEVSLALPVAVPCGLVINELVTNALKHAFRESDATTAHEIVLTWEDNGTHWRLGIADNGPGLPASLDWEHAKTLGLRLVQLLTQQLKGTISLAPGSGCHFVLEFPKP